MSDTQQDNKAILERAIRKAIDGGWQPPYEHFTVYVPRLNWIEFHNLPKANHVSMEPYTLIFNHDFAKALWGLDRLRSGGFGETYYDAYQNFPDKLPNYKFHLQQMVIADDPIKYLGANL